MPSTFSEALAPLAARMPRAARNLEILRVSCDLDGEDFDTAIKEARSAVLAWAKRRAGGTLPEEAWAFQEFELLAGGRNSAAVRISNDEVDFWAMRAEDPDKDVPQRVWSTEVVIGGNRGARPKFSARLIVSTNEQELGIEHHVPGFVLQLAASPGLIRGGRRLLHTPQVIETENGAEDLCDHLLDPDRRLPLIVATLASGTTTPMIDDATLARATAGFARVVRVSAEQAWVITRRLGKVRSVFGGAVRLYLPGLSVTNDPYRHRLFLAKQLDNPDDSAACVSWLRKTVADFSISSTRLGNDVLEFATMRTASRRLVRDARKAQGTTNEDLLRTAEELIQSLEQEIEEKRAEIDGYVNEVTEAEARAEASEQEYRSLLFKCRELEARGVNGGGDDEAEAALPETWGDFLDWLDATYPDRVLLTPSARGMVKAPAFEDVTCVARAVRWLATEHFERRNQGGGTLRDAIVEEGVRNSLCGGDEYPVFWRGRRYKVDWHVKNGGNTRDPRRCLRIYYFWEPDAGQTVIDHLPGHRVTSAT